MNWCIKIAIAYRKTPGKFRYAFVKFFQKKRGEASDYYKMLNEKVVSHLKKHGLSYNSYALNCHGTHTFEAKNKFITVCFERA